MTTQLQLHDVHFEYSPATPVLQGISLAVGHGEFAALVGASGSGKSTVLHLLAGLLTPQHGAIAVHGQPPAPGRTGFMPQRDSLLPWRTALDNAALGLVVRGVPWREARERARALWDTFGLAGAEQRYPAQLSGGMRQRVAFLRTVLGDHDILLLDEPFGALDALTRASMQSWLLDMVEHLQRTVLLVTHDAEEAALLADRVFVLHPVAANQSQNAHVTEIPVPLPRPREYSLVTDPALQRHRVKILQAVGVR